MARQFLSKQSAPRRMRQALNLALLLGASLGCLGSWGASSAAPLVGLLDKLPKNLAETDKSTYARGTIAGQDYLAIRVDVGDEQHHDTRTVLVIAKIQPDRSYQLVRVMHLTSPSEVDAEIKNGSIYIRSATAHHGLYSAVYQFKPAGTGFRLVGLERQSITADERGHATGHTELWEGASADLVHARATYWAQSFNLKNPKGQKAWEAALQWHRQGIASPDGSRQQVRLKLHRRWSLQAFDLDTFDASFLCHHFDHRLTFHNDCR